MPDRPLVVVTRSSEHVQLLLGTSVLVGLGMLLAAPAPQTMLSLFPRWFVTVWALTWVASGAAGTVALLWRRDLSRALLMERAALVLNASAAGLFAVSAFVAAGLRAWVVGLFLAGWTTANVVRAVRIGREAKKLSEVVKGR